MNGLPSLEITYNASGAAEAAQRGRIVVVVDVVDASTTAEGALSSGAIAIFAASPDGLRLPFPLDPEAVGRAAGRLARDRDAEVILVVEPRVGTDEERLARSSCARNGVLAEGGTLGAVVPNQGMETVKLASFSERVVLIVSNSGGVAFDAALAAEAPAVLTATVARTLSDNGIETARLGAARALQHARALGTGLSVVAASSNSWEDVFGAEQIARTIIEAGYLRLDRPSG